MSSDGGRFADDVQGFLIAARKTHAESNARYKDNWRKVGELMAILYPDGVTLKTPDDFARWHLIELMMVKITRYANGGNPQDSLQDLAVYTAMVATLDAEIYNRNLPTWIIPDNAVSEDNLDRELAD